MKDWNIEAITGYKPKTTFYMDFSIADEFGIEAIKDTCTRAFEDWKTNVEYLTELVMVLNWKIWEHSETNPEYAKLYNSLWKELDGWCMDHLEGEDIRYFLRTTD